DGRAIHFALEVFSKSLLIVFVGHRGTSCARFPMSGRAGSYLNVPRTQVHRIAGGSHFIRTPSLKPKQGFIGDCRDVHRSLNHLRYPRKRILVISSALSAAPPSKCRLYRVCSNRHRPLLSPDCSHAIRNPWQKPPERPAPLRFSLPE